MQFKIFTITPNDDAAIEEMNKFLRGNKILRVDKQWEVHLTRLRASPFTLSQYGLSRS